MWSVPLDISPMYIICCLALATMDYMIRTKTKANEMKNLRSSAYIVQEQKNWSPILSHFLIRAFKNVFEDIKYFLKAVSRCTREVLFRVRGHLRNTKKT